MGLAEVQWNVELPVSLFSQCEAALKVADAHVLRSNQPVCMRFQLQAQASCEVQLRADDVHVADAAAPCVNGYVCQISMGEGRVQSQLHKIQEGAVVGTLESVPTASNALEGEGEVTFWIVLGPGAVVVGVGEVGENVIQGSFDEQPIAVQSVFYNRSGESQPVPLTSVWIGKLLVRGNSADVAGDDDGLLRM